LPVLYELRSIEKYPLAWCLQYQHSFSRVMRARQLFHGEIDDRQGEPAGRFLFIVDRLLGPEHAGVWRNGSGSKSGNLVVLNFEGLPAQLIGGPDPRKSIAGAPSSPPEADKRKRSDQMSDNSANMHLIVQNESDRR
jgi:hypothetical protein